VPHQYKSKVFKTIKTSRLLREKRGAAEKTFKSARNL